MVTSTNPQIGNIRVFIVMLNKVLLRIIGGCRIFLFQMGLGMNNCLGVVGLRFLASPKNLTRPTWLHGSALSGYVFWLRQKI